MTTCTSLKTNEQRQCYNSSTPAWDATPPAVYGVAGHHGYQSQQQQQHQQQVSYDNGGRQYGAVVAGGRQYVVVPSATYLTPQGDSHHQSLVGTRLEDPAAQHHCQPHHAPSADHENMATGITATSRFYNSFIFVALLIIIRYQTLELLFHAELLALILYFVKNII